MKKEKIRNAAVKILSKENYQTMKTADIAREAEIAEGTIYRYYKSKKEIFVDVLRNYRERIPEWFFKNTSEDKSIKDNIERLTNNFFSSIEEASAVYKMFNKALSEIDDEDIRAEQFAAMQSNIEKFRMIVEWGVKRGEINMDDEAISVTVMAMLGLAEAYLKRHMVGWNVPLRREETERVAGILMKILL